MKPFSVSHPAFRPLWVRVLMVGVCLGWAVVEFLYSSPLWAAIFGVAGLYLFWGFFVAYDPEEYKRPPKE